MDVDLYRQALDRTRSIFAGLRPEHMDKPTPCADWDVRTLAGHIVGGTWMFAGAARGEPPSGDPDADPLGDDPLAAYDASAAAGRAAWAEPGATEKTLHLPLGEMPGEIALSIAFLDTLVHGWDLATATGQDPSIDADLAVPALETAKMITAQGRGDYFGPAVPIDDDAAPYQRLVAHLGRQP